MHDWGDGSFCKERSHGRNAAESLDVKCLCSGCRERRKSSGLMGARYFNCRHTPSNLNFDFVSIYSAYLFLICLLISDLHPFLLYSTNHLIKGTLYLHVKNSEFRPVVEISKH